jgi:hypothetical protein
MNLSTIHCEVVEAAGSVRERTVLGGARQAGYVTDVRRNVGSSGDFEYERRMNNWRLWRLSERRSLGGSPFPIYNLSPRPPRGENVMPILAGEAEETDRAVFALPPALRRVVEVWFLCSGSVNQKRKMLRCRRERMFEMLREARLAIFSNLQSARHAATRLS